MQCKFIDWRLLSVQIPTISGGRSHYLLHVQNNEGRIRVPRKSHCRDTEGLRSALRWETEGITQGASERTVPLQCAGFAIDASFFRCVMLKTYDSPYKICAAEATMFLKTSSGCEGEWQKGPKRRRKFTRSRRSQWLRRNENYLLSVTPSATSSPSSSDSTGGINNYIKMIAFSELPTRAAVFFVLEPTESDPFSLYTGRSLSDLGAVPADWATATVWFFIF